MVNTISILVYHAGGGVGILPLSQVPLSIREKAFVIVLEYCLPSPLNLGQRLAESCFVEIIVIPKINQRSLARSRMTNIR